MTLRIPEAALDQHIAILGKTRAGKSTVMRGLAEHLLKRKQPVCIVDPKGDWWGIKLAADGKHSGFPVVIFGGEHADVPINQHSGGAVAELFATGNRPCLIDLGGWMVGERTRFWIDFASGLFKHVRGKRWLLVDEVHNFAPKGKIFDPDAGKALHWSNRLASEGLGKGLHMIVASQRPQKVHNDLLTSAETLIAMRVLHPSDREAVTDWIKGCGDMALGNKVLGSLAQMARGEGWAWSPEAKFGPERIQFPMFKTYDSFKPQTADDVKGLKGWAEVDLEDVKQKLAGAVEEAKANDPKALRAEIAKLKAELGKKPQVASSLAPIEDPRKTEAARLEGWNARHVAGIADANKRDAGNMREIRSRLLKVTDFVSALAEEHEQGMPVGREIRSRPPAAKIVPSVTVHREVEYRRPTPRPIVPSGTNGSLPKAERLILTVLAQRAGNGVNGVPLDRIAAIAGYAVKGGGFNNAIGSLRAKQYITRDEYPRITHEGTAALGEFEPLPTGGELLQYWMGKLGKAERSILEAASGGLMDKESIARVAGYEPTGGGFNNALGRLRTLGLISGRGAIELHEDLR